RDVDDLDLRSDCLDHAVAGTNEVVLQPQVTQEGDEHPPTLRAGRLDGLDQAVEIVRLSLANDSHAGSLRRGGRLGPDRNRRNRRPKLPAGAGRRGRGEHYEISFERLLRADRPGPVQRNEFGAELIDEYPPSA